jgi:hypothetical protein
MLMDDPRQTKSRTDAAEPNLDKPRQLRLLPVRAIDRSESVEPMCRKS